MDYQQLKEKINTLVIFNTMSMSDKAAAEIEKFVANGGTIVASGEVSLYDENGHKRENFALSDILGFSHVKEHKGPVFLTVTNENPITGDITGRFIEDDFYVQVKDLQDSTNIYGYIVTSDQKKYPGIITNDYGKGKVVYFASHPEKKYNFYYYNDPKIIPGKYWVDPRDKTYGEIIKRAVTCYNSGQPLIIENLPKGVITEVYSHENKKMKGFQVHIANFLGGYVQEGVIPMYHPISFPEVKNNLPRIEQPVSIKVKAENVKDVFLLSPDFDATVKLDYKLSQGYIHVILPTAYRYFILYFSQGDAAPFLELNPDNVTDQLPPAKELIIKTEKPLAGDYDPGFTTVFANEENFQGGYRIGVYKSEIGAYLYGQDGQHYEATAFMNLESIPANPILEIGGMDDNAETKAQMEIKINGQLVYTGPANYPDRSWGLNEYAVDPAFLKKGKNVIEFRNLEKGVVGSIPWYGINFVRIKQGQQEKDKN
jgi:hypothetical protein